MSKVIMVQGTMSNAGKSLLVAGLCRIFQQDGYRVAPFKSQNMALTSFVTKEGLEMGRAQVMQAEAAGIEPEVCMNPILLKPTNDTGSQVIINGKPIGVMSAVEYYRHKRDYIPYILKAYRELEKKYDVIVIEGAGSPAGGFLFLIKVPAPPEAPPRGGRVRPIRAEVRQAPRDCPRRRR